MEKNVVDLFRKSGTVFVQISTVENINTIPNLHLLVQVRYTFNEYFS